MNLWRTIYSWRDETGRRVLGYISGELYIAGVMKLVDVPDSKSGVPRDVWVRLPPPALEKKVSNWS